MLLVACAALFGLLSAGCAAGFSRSAAVVFGPTSPSTFSPRAFWNARTAARVFGPNFPSTARCAPRPFSRFCRSETRWPASPSPTGCWLDGVARLSLLPLPPLAGANWPPPVLPLATRGCTAESNARLARMSPAADMSMPLLVACAVALSRSHSATAAAAFALVSGLTSSPPAAHFLTCEIAVAMARDSSMPPWIRSFAMCCM